MDDPSRPISVPGPERAGPIETAAISTLPLVRPRASGFQLRFGVLLRRVLADRHVALAITTVLPVLIVEAINPGPETAPTVAAALVYLASQLALARVPGVRGDTAWHLVRFTTAILFVALITAIDGETSATLPILYVPIVALAAAVGTRPGVAIAALALGVYVSSLTVVHGWDAMLRDALVPFAVVVFMAIGTRLVVSSLERSLDRVRHSITAERRRARRLRAIEQVGRILAKDGPSPAVLEEIMDVLVRTFGYQYPSLYLWSGETLRLGAHRGYEHPILEFDTEVGIIGRVARTGEGVFAPDVSLDPDYAQADPAVRSEISVPLLSDESLLGVLNVESAGAVPLDRDDFASLRTIADRLAASIALGRERQELAERAALLGRLTEAFTALGGILDPSPLHAAVARAATAVVTCDIGVLTLADGSAGYRVAAAAGAEAMVGMQIAVGEGATGRAIASRATVLDDRLDRSGYPQAARRVVMEPEVAVLAIPMMREDRAVGALTFVRRVPGHGFTHQEREIAGLLTAQAALAIANAALHAEAREAAITDSLTGLHNRRLLDTTLARLSAARARQRPEERRPFAAIMFDLDNFGELNKLHGHAAGDAVLRTFAGVLAGRFRASDIVARYGGEEFLVVLDGASRDDAVRVAETIRTAFADLTVPVLGGEVRCTVSAGCAGLEATSDCLDPMIEVADVGLVMAKSGGRNQVVAA